MLVEPTPHFATGLLDQRLDVPQHSAAGHEHLLVPLCQFTVAPQVQGVVQGRDHGPVDGPTVLPALLRHRAGCQFGNQGLDKAAGDINRRVKRHLYLGVANSLYIVALVVYRVCPVQFGSIRGRNQTQGEDL